jgi:anaerobic magnesium-protoporphyrin IX monomethyl ester cyclase
MKSKKILLISPPNTFLTNVFTLPRMGLLYLGTALKQAGYQPIIKHLESLNELQSLIQDDFDFIGISATTIEYLSAIQILNYFKREKHPAIVAIGGSHASTLPEEPLQNGFDLVITGEADLHIKDIVEWEKGQPRLYSCGCVQHLDQVPIPDRSLIHLDKPWQPNLGIKCDNNIKIAGIILSRGCPYHCQFCGPHFPYRRRSESNIEAELKKIAYEGYEGLIILDDLPFLNAKQVAQFCQVIKPLGIQFRSNFRVDQIEPQTLALLKKSGCCRIQLGIESATQQILLDMNKKISSNDAGNAIDLCHAYDIAVKAMFMFGLPGDGLETAENIISFVQKYRPDEIQVSIFVPLLGSPLWIKYSNRVTDYNSLTFFGEVENKIISGVGNDHLNAEEILTLWKFIKKECSSISHIDLGLPFDKKLSN